MERSKDGNIESKPVANQIDDPSICVVRIGEGERVSGRLAEMLRPVDPGSLQEVRVPANTDLELHYHDFDEYWLFTSGRPLVTLRSPSGAKVALDVGPGDLVACVRGVEHTNRADHEIACFQFTSVRKDGDREGHLTR